MNTGQPTERIIAQALNDRNLVYTRQRKMGGGIYGWKLRSDFYIHPTQNYPNGLAIESKWQEVGGTADEKFPLLVANIKQCYPCPVIVVEDGDGARDGAREWLRAQVDGVQLLAVMTLTEFLTWMRRAEFGNLVKGQPMLGQ